MDACDEVMIKVARPQGLIRYDSEKGIREGKQKLTSPRAIAYSFILLVLFAVFVALLVTRSDLAATVTRFRGMTYQEREAGKVSNLYEVSFINKTFDNQDVEIQVQNRDFEIEIVGHDKWQLEGQSRFEGRFFIVKDQENIKTNQENIILLLLQNGKIIDEITTSFVGPTKP